MEGLESSSKKHKKHKKDRQGIKLILKVGNSSTPEHNMDDSPSHFSVPVTGDEDDSVSSLAPFAGEKHKKSKKKKKKKEKERDRDKDRKKKHKEKRKKRDGEQSLEENTGGGDSSAEPPVKKIRKDLHKIHPLLMKPRPPPPTPREGIVSSIKTEPRACVRKLKEKTTPLSQLVLHLHGLLERRDMRQFFAWPVTDNIAPGYSHIISQPMDLSTMRQKIDDGAYTTLSQYIDNFKLKCGNAMTYNHPETIYFKSAKNFYYA